MSSDRTHRLRGEIKPTLKLALPLALGQLAQIGMGLTDTIFLGTLGGEAIAAGGLAAATFFILATAFQGLPGSVAIVISHARGAGETGRIALAVRGALLLATAAVAPLVLLAWNIEAFLLAVGEPPKLSADIAAYIRVLMLCAPALLWLGTLRIYLAAMQHPRAVMVVSFGGLILNALLNYTLISGHWGMPALGFLGSATATVISVWSMLIATYIWIRFVPEVSQHLSRGHIDWSVVREQFHLGWPMAITFAVEATLFLVAGLMMGLISTTAVAAHQVTLHVASATFMIPLAFSQAANVRVGFHVGAGDPGAARDAGFTAFALGVGFMACAAVVMFTAPVAIAGLFNLDTADAADAEVIAIIVPLMIVGAFFQVFDGAQCIAVGALRGLKDTRAPMWFAAAGYWGIGFPLAWLLGFTLDWGPAGIWWGLAGGLAAVAIVLSLRFLRLTGRLVAQMRPDSGAVLHPAVN